MRYIIGTLRILAWSWAILIILGICVFEIYLQGFFTGMRAASMTILSPAAMYIFLPSFVLAALAAITRKISETWEEVE